MSKEIDYASAALSFLGRVALMEFLGENYKDFDPWDFAAFVEALGDSEGYAEIGTHDSVTGAPVTLDLRGPEFWGEVMSAHVCGAGAGEGCQDLDRDWCQDCEACTLWDGEMCTVCGHKWGMGASDE